MSGSIFYAYGMVVGKEDWNGALRLTGSIFAAQGATEALKETVREERPNGRDDLSFPSGHTSGAFSGAMFVHKRYGLKSALAPYLMSGIVAWSRVEQDAHYWHDVIASAGVSAIFTWLLVDAYKVQVSASAGHFFIGLKQDF